jgi:hypothetical protein
MVSRQIRQIPKLCRWTFYFPYSIGAVKQRRERSLRPGAIGRLQLRAMADEVTACDQLAEIERREKRTTSRPQPRMGYADKRGIFADFIPAAGSGNLSSDEKSRFLFLGAQVTGHPSP